MGLWPPDDSARISRNEVIVDGGDEVGGENLEKLIASVENGSRLGSRVSPYGFSKNSLFLLLLSFLFMFG